MPDDRPTEEQIREALEWLERVTDNPSAAGVSAEDSFATLAALTLARRGALLGEAADLLREVEVSWGTERGLYPPTLDAMRALLARIDQTEVDG